MYSKYRSRDSNPYDSKSQVFKTWASTYSATPARLFSRYCELPSRVAGHLFNEGHVSSDIRFISIPWSMSVQWIDCTTYNDLVGQVGVEGIEPTRCRSHGIYSPANLLSRLHSQIIGKDLRTFLYRLYVKPAGVLKNSTYSISFNKLSFILNLFRPCT